MGTSGWKIMFRRPTCCSEAASQTGVAAGEFLGQSFMIGLHLSHVTPRALKVTYGRQAQISHSFKEDAAAQRARGMKVSRLREIKRKVNKR
jgi:hypothetical protein